MFLKIGCLAVEKLTTLLCFGLLYNVPYVKSLVNSNLIQRVMCIELWIVESVLLLGRFYAFLIEFLREITSM